MRLDLQITISKMSTPKMWPSLCQIKPIFAYIYQIRRSAQC